MPRTRHTLAKLATTWWLLVCLCAPQLATLVHAGEDTHACCRNKSVCCCRNRTGKASAIIGDRKDCARTCGLPSLAAGLESLLPAPLPLLLCLAACAMFTPRTRHGYFPSFLSPNLFERPPPAFA